MPKTPMNKDNGLIFGQHNIGCAIKVFTIQPEAITHAVQDGAYISFRAGVRSLDPRHVPASVTRRNAINQCLQLQLQQAYRIRSERYLWPEAEELRFRPVCIEMSGDRKKNSYPGKSVTARPRVP